MERTVAGRVDAHHVRMRTGGLCMCMCVLSGKVVR